MAALGEDPDDLHIVGFDLVSVDVGEDGGGAHLHLAPEGGGDGLAGGDQGGVLQRAEDTAGGVCPQLTQVPVGLEGAVELAGVAGGPLLHVGDGGGQNGPRLQRHEESGVHIVDAVPQGAEEPGGGLIEGHGADTGHGVPDPRPQTVGAVGAGGGLGGELHLLLVPDGADAHLISLQLLEHRPDLLNGVHLGVVDVGDDVALAEPAGAGRGALPCLAGHVGKPYHQHAVRKELDTHRTSHGDHHVGALRGCHGGQGLRRGRPDAQPQQRHGNGRHQNQAPQQQKGAGPWPPLLFFSHKTTPFAKNNADGDQKTAVRANMAAMDGKNAAPGLAMKHTFGMGRGGKHRMTGDGGGGHGGFYRFFRKKADGFINGLWAHTISQKAVPPRAAAGGRDGICPSCRGDCW